MKRVTIHVTNKDRWSEIAILMQSLRTQSFRDWDLLILDDGSGSPIVNSYFIVGIINQLREEGHFVQVFQGGPSGGVCAARNFLLDNDKTGSDLILRVDDDVILEPDYIQKLIAVIDAGYDIASGVTPNFGGGFLKRKTEMVKPIINKVIIDSDGNIVQNGDDCGMLYDKGEIIQTHHFRSNAIYRRNLDIKYEDNLTFVGFREEEFFSFRALMKGAKIGVHTGAVAWHFRCPSGGCRVPNYPECVMVDNATFERFVKNNKDKFADKVVVQR